MIRKRHSIIVTSIVVALVLQIVPLPVQVDMYRPDWVLVVVAYWSMALPNRVNVGVAFVVGLAVDVLVGTTLGIHSLGLSVSVYILVANYQRLRNYSVWQQAIVIGLLSSFYHLVTFWVQHLLTDIYFQIDYLWPVVTSMLIWPWVFWLLRKTRRQFSIT